MTTKVKIVNQGPCKLKVMGADQAVQFLESGDEVEFKLYDLGRCELLHVTAEDEPEAAEPNDDEKTDPE